MTRATNEWIIDLFTKKSLFLEMKVLKISFVIILSISWSYLIYNYFIAIIFFILCTFLTRWWIIEKYQKSVVMIKLLIILHLHIINKFYIIYLILVLNNLFLFILSFTKYLQTKDFYLLLLLLLINKKYKII